MNIDLANYFLICGFALFIATLTLFSGFGLGTLLMPAFALFFPIPVAVAITAIVHMLNNLFKVGLLYKDIVRMVLFRFGIPAVLAALPGAWLLIQLSEFTALYTWQYDQTIYSVTPIQFTMGVLIVFFALVELSPAFIRFQISQKYLFVGGVLSGFFGGLSGHQGALRAIFLSSLNLTPAQFAASQAVIAVMVDMVRIMMYAIIFLWGSSEISSQSLDYVLITAATISAFLGSYIGKNFLPKVNFSFVRAVTGTLLMVIGISLLLGLI